MYGILIQYLPGSDQILVARLKPEDPIYEFEDKGEAEQKAAELQTADPSGRQYKVVKL